MNDQGVHNEDVPNVVGRLAVEGACAGAHKLFGEIHGGESLGSSQRQVTGSSQDFSGRVRIMRANAERDRRVERLSTGQENAG